MRYKSITRPFRFHKPVYDCKPDRSWARHSRGLPQKIWYVIMCCALLAVALSACDALPVSFLQPTPTATATNTPVPPTATFTPLPTATDTPLPPPTFTPPPTVPPPPTNPPPPTATLTKDEAILVYYINKDEAGQYGCGEALWYVKTHQRKTGNIPEDIRYALHTILSYHNDTIGILYNPGYASSLSVSSVTLDGGNVVVNLSGTYTATKDRCDAPRFRDQLRFTIKQFQGITGIQIFINGATLGDTISRGSP